MQEAIDGICLCIHQLPVEVADLKDTISNVIYTLSEVVSYLEAKNSKEIADLKQQIQELTVWKYN